MKRFLFIFVALFPLTHFCQTQTDGFALTKVATVLQEGSKHKKIEVPSAPFRYLGKGGQSYVFISEDGETVLKLLRSSRLNTLKFIHTFLPLSSLEKGINAQEKGIEKTLKSYHLAYKKLKKETGLIAVHLDHTPLKGTLQIIDRNGIVHQLDPNHYPFILQKRALLLKEKIKEVLEREGVDGVKKMLHSLFALIKKRWKKGIEDLDPNLAKNFGFCGDQPIEIDGGRFETGLPLSLEKIGRSKTDLTYWIKATHPELSDIFEKAYSEFIDGL